MVKDQEAQLLDFMKHEKGITRVLTRCDVISWHTSHLPTDLVHSGGQPRAIDGLEQIRSLMNISARDPDRKPEIMPGSGITPWIAEELVEKLIPHGLRSIHISGGCLIHDSFDGVPKDPVEDFRAKKRHTGMLFRRQGMGMGVSQSGDPAEEWLIWRTDASKVRAVREAMDTALAKLSGKQYSGFSPLPETFWRFRMAREQYDDF